MPETLDPFVYVIDAAFAADFEDVDVDDDPATTLLEFLSSAANAYNRDYHAETAAGAQRPMLNVFHREAGAIRHFWGSELFYAPNEPGQDPRHLGTLEPVWNLLDLTREGRPAVWDEQLTYGDG